MGELFTTILIVAAILGVCGAYFKFIIMRWLANDVAATIPDPGASPAAPLPASDSPSIH